MQHTYTADRVFEIRGVGSVTVVYSQRRNGDNKTNSSIASAITIRKRSAATHVQYTLALTSNFRIDMKLTETEGTIIEQYLYFIKIIFLKLHFMYNYNCGNAQHDGRPALVRRTDAKIFTRCEHFCYHSNGYRSGA